MSGITLQPRSMGPLGPSTSTATSRPASTPTFHPRWDSIQPVALGAMITSTGTADRWTLRRRHRRSAGLGPCPDRHEINADKDNELTSGSGLVARWGLDEGSGNSVGDSIDTGANPTADGDDHGHRLLVGPGLQCSASESATGRRAGRVFDPPGHRQGRLGGQRCSRQRHRRRRRLADRGPGR